ncbi:hypothetical protein ACRTEC_05625 [Janibacter indicus]
MSAGDWREPASPKARSLHCRRAMQDRPATHTHRELLPGADLGESLVVQGEEVGTAEPQIRAWLRRTGLADG